jgi:serine/threonine protein kinase
MQLILKWQAKNESHMYNLSDKLSRQKRLTMGRSKECQIVLDNMTVSRQHAELFIKKDTIYLRNISSNNPIWVNKQVLRSKQTVELRPGYILKIGGILLDVETGAPPPDEEPTLIKKHAKIDFLSTDLELTNRQLGKYKLEERLGKGGMAEVYKAHQPGIDRLVAIKVLHPHLTDLPDFVTRFQREAKSMGQLQHPHILRVIDFDAENNIYYMVMEFIQGGTLQTYLNRRKTLSPEESLRLVAQIVDALNYAHQQNMIHRDIKPENIMFRDDDYTHTVLADFGLVRLLDDTMTTVGTRIGTPAYMSPEAAKGEKVDGRADIYSVGILLYEMLTGRLPHASGSPYDTITKIINEPVPPPTQFRPDLPPPVEELIMKALNKKVANRFQSAAEFGKAIQQVQSTLQKPSPATFQPATTSPVHKTKSRIKLGLVIGGIVVIIAIMAGLLAMFML